MKILHTSDWHLGKMLYGRRCHNEFKEFLLWLADEIEKQQADYLLVAGDIFDTTTPANSTQGLYYSFLHKVSTTCCRHVVIIGGNHDSPSLLHAPRKLLEHLNVTVVGSVSNDPADEVLSLRDPQDNIELIICAIPFLRDKDVRKAEAGETIDTKAQKLIQGIGEHYEQVADIARAIQIKENEDAPIIGMGHLFTAGGKIDDNNEVRELYVGSLAHVHSSIFPQHIQYVALGHLHIAQTVNDSENIRYCGSPLQLSFSKKPKKPKTITAITISEEMRIEHIEVPPFLNLQSIHGNYNEIFTQLGNLIQLNEKVLLEIVLTGTTTASYHEELMAQVRGTQVEILRVINQQIHSQNMAPYFQQESLDSLSELDVFRKCLDAHEISDDDKQELEYNFREVLQALHEEDNQ